MENIRKRVDVRLVTDKNKLLKMSSKPTYISNKIFNENRVAVHKVKKTLVLNRPAYIGLCILDLSKTLLYDFHYNYIKKSIEIKQIYYSQTVMRLRLKTYTEISGMIKRNLIIVTTRRIHNISTRQIKK